MFSPFQLGRANLRCKTSWVSSLVNNDLRSEVFSNAGLSLYELIIESWSKIDRISILTECLFHCRVWLKDFSTET